MRKLLAFLIIGVLIVLSVVFASYVVFMQFRPEREVRTMMINMVQQTSVEQDSGFSWSREEEGERVSTTLYTSGPIEVTEESYINHATNFRVVHLSESNSYQDLSGEWRSVDGVSYLKYEAPGPDVEGVEFDGDTWIEFDAGELPAWGAVIPGLNAPLSSILSDEPWSTEGVDRLKFLLAYADILHVEYNGITEIIDGTNTRLIDGYLDEDAIEAFLLDLVRAKEARQPNDQERLVATTQAKQLSRLTLRFWIGISDQLLYRFQAAGGFEDLDGTDLVPVDVRVDIHYPQTQDAITSPTNTSTTSFDDVFEAVFGVLPSSGLGSSGSDMTIVSTESAHLPVTTTSSSDDPDGDGLANLLEVFYGTSTTVADSDGDGMNDGDEVRSGRNPRGSGSLFGFGF